MMDETRGSRPSGRSNLLSMKPTIPTTLKMEWDSVSGALEVLKEQVHERERVQERKTYLQGIQVDPWNGLSHELP